MDAAFFLVNLNLYNIIAGLDKERSEGVNIVLQQTITFALHSLNQLLWPTVCVNCRQVISDSDNKLCKNCWDRLIFCSGADYCRRCGRDVGRFAMLGGTCPDCQGKEVRFDNIARAGVYEHSLRTMILSFKNGRTELDSILGFLANSALQ